MFEHWAQKWSRTATESCMQEMVDRRLLLPDGENSNESEQANRDTPALALRPRLDKLWSDLKQAKTSKTHWEIQAQQHRNIVDVAELAKDGRSVNNAIGVSNHPLRNKVVKHRMAK